MRLTAHYDFPASPQRLAELLATPSFVDAAARAAGAESTQVSVSGQPTGEFTVTVRATLPAAQLPARAQMLAAGGLELRQASVWQPPKADGSREASAAAEIAGAPVHCEGRIVLSPNRDGSQLDYSADVKASIPLLGRSIEEAAVPAMLKVLTTQHQTALAWLSEGTAAGAEA
ncbi:MAG: DUF2505 domain-containing protein [Bifidobacteriaceae bacterium]|jgi:hypothetical protein|nr:DUF2505 domain-containing protein [Bifidobacteriaceae bacterium]